MNKRIVVSRRVRRVCRVQSGNVIFAGHLFPGRRREGEVRPEDPADVFFLQELERTGDGLQALEATCAAIDAGRFPDKPVSTVMVRTVLSERLRREGLAPGLPVA